jgi:hypothetical protein
VKVLELKPGGQAGLYAPSKDLAPSRPQFPLSTSSAATDLVANLTSVASAPATANFGLPPMSLPLGQQRPSPFVTPHVPPAVPHLADTADIPRYHKLDFPTFDGKEDPLGWLNRCEQFFWGTEDR